LSVVPRSLPATRWTTITGGQKLTDPATSMQVRDEFEALLVRDRLGPWDGPE